MPEEELEAKEKQTAAASMLFVDRMRGKSGRAPTEVIQELKERFPKADFQAIAQAYSLNQVDRIKRANDPAQPKT